MKKFFLCAAGAASLLLSGYLALMGQGNEVIYGALIAITVTCVILASIVRAPARAPSVEHITHLGLVSSAVTRGMTLFDYMLLGACVLFLCALLATPAVLIFVAAVLLSGIGVGILLWVLSRHTK